MLFENYQKAVQYAQDNNPQWRKGQAAFNVLMLNRPDLSEQVRGSGIDPFHHDERLDPFYCWVRDHWNANKPAAKGDR